MKLNFKTWVLLLAVVVFILTAYFSVGYYHVDEHYQVIELAGLKAGWNTPNDLAWEYHSHIRSGLLPSIAYVIFEINAFFQVKDIYTSLFVLRLITGLLTVTALVFFFRKSIPFLFKSEQPESFLKLSYLALLLLSWYIPFLGVRFSSETWSAIFLIFGLGFYLEIGKTKYHALIIGILFGLAFTFRFQMAFGLIGIAIYHVIFGQQKLKTTCWILSGFSMILLLGLFIDRWFYSEWVFTPWKYFMMFVENDILSNAENTFDSSSWTYYVKSLYQLPTRFVGVVTIISLVVGVIFNRKNPIVWFLAPFILFHLLISHKEERFFFPIAFLFPFFIVSTFLLLKNQSGKFKPVLKPLVYVTIAILFFIHIIGLSVMTTKSAGLGRSEISEYIHTHYGNKKIMLVHTPFTNPYNPWGSLVEKAYLEKDIEFREITNLGNFSDSLFSGNRVKLVAFRGYDVDHNYFPGNLEKWNLKLKAQTISKREQSMNRYVRGFENCDVIYLYELEQE